MIPRHFKLHWQTGQWITSGAQLALLVIGAQTESPLGWSVCLGLMALLSLWAWSGALKRRRAIADTPTSRIASAAQGYVELQGNGRPMAGLPLVSPLSGGRCLWYRNTTEQKDSENQWKVINRDESEASFVLDDGSGLCAVDPAPKSTPGTSSSGARATTAIPNGPCGTATTSMSWAASTPGAAATPCWTRRRT